MVKCYHFCEKVFWEQLNAEKVINADNNIVGYKKTREPASYAKEYVFLKQRINGGKGMFFAWSNPEYKKPIRYNNKGNFVLLELFVPRNETILTDYQSWCSLAMDIHDCDGDLNEVDQYCKDEYGMAKGLMDSYESIFNIDAPSEIQVLLKKIDLDWVKSAKYVSEKNI